MKEEIIIKGAKAVLATLDGGNRLGNAGKTANANQGIYLWHLL